jgi:plasmid stabilization system protein ParE
MNSVKYLPSAETELLESALYYEQQSEGLGDCFIRAVEAAERSVAAYPLWGEPWAHSLRRQRVRGFPFALIYRLQEKEIIIYAVAHLSRRPEYWRDRI